MLYQHILHSRAVYNILNASTSSICSCSFDRDCHQYTNTITIQSKCLPRKVVYVLLTLFTPVYIFLPTARKRNTCNSVCMGGSYCYFVCYAHKCDTPLRLSAHCVSVLSAVHASAHVSVGCAHTLGAATV